MWAVGTTPRASLPTLGKGLGNVIGNTVARDEVRRISAEENHRAVRTGPGDAACADEEQDGGWLIQTWPSRGNHRGAGVNW